MSIPFISTAFDGGSKLDFERGDGWATIQIVYDHERGTTNRQGTHWWFRLEAKAGEKIRLRLQPSLSIYGGRPGQFFRKGMVGHLSTDGKEWRPFPLTLNPDFSIETEIVLPADSVEIASLPPYMARELDCLLQRYASHPNLRVSNIGSSVEGRPIRMVELTGRTERARSRPLLVRARAHPWEMGGNWFMDGLIERMLEAASDDLDRFSLCYLPLTNIDGIIRGYSRFNVRGADLNRGFDKPFDETIAPENVALIRLIENMRREGRLPFLAIDLHNDLDGDLHVAAGPSAYLDRMRHLDALMRKHTPFRERMVQSPAPHVFASGLGALYGIDAVIFELNAIWCPGVNEVPTAQIWKDFGRSFVDALNAYQRENFGVD